MGQVGFEIKVQMKRIYLGQILPSTTRLKGPKESNRIVYSFIHESSLPGLKYIHEAEHITRVWQEHQRNFIQGKTFLRDRVADRWSLELFNPAIVQRIFSLLHIEEAFLFSVIDQKLFCRF